MPPPTNRTPLPLWSFPNKQKLSHEENRKNRGLSYHKMGGGFDVNVPLQRLCPVAAFPAPDALWVQPHDATPSRANHDLPFLLNCEVPRMLGSGRGWGVRRDSNHVGGLEWMAQIRFKIDDLPFEPYLRPCATPFNRTT